MSEFANGRTLLLEALPLMASYLFSSTVELGPLETGTSPGAKNEDDTDRFLSELAARHTIATALRLQSLVPAIERRYSTSTSLTSYESDFAFIDSLNMPQYIAHRVQRKVEKHRTYPIHVQVESPDTPENALVVQALRSISRQLARSPFHTDSSEGNTSARLYHWSRSRLRRPPWADVRRLDSVDRLKRQTNQRTLKKQTGNDLAYQALVRWTEEWQVDPNLLGGSADDDIVDGILAFPVNDFFWEKVFEVWTLQAILHSLQRIGLQRIMGPQPLHLRNAGPIAVFASEKQQASIWFQRQKPMGSPRWAYSASGRSLSGIPDVIVASDTSNPLLIDAKYRYRKQTNRSEEIYKMLGYAENFRHATRMPFLTGVLLFPGETTSTTLTAVDGGRLSLLGIDPANRDRAYFEHLLDLELGTWLNM